MKFVRYEINDALCRRCMACLKACPRGAVRQLIDQDQCDRCGTCAKRCKLRAIAMRRGLFR